MSYKPSKNFSRLNVDISKELHKRIKLRAIEFNLPIRKLVLRAIIKMLNEQDKYLEEKKGS